MFRLHEAIGLPLLLVAKRMPDLAAIPDALLTLVPGGKRKWRIIERLGPMEPCRGVHVQRVGLTPAEGEAVVERFAVNGYMPEPLRVAHLVASGFS